MKEHAGHASKISNVLDASLRKQCRNSQGEREEERGEMRMDRGEMRMENGEWRMEEGARREENQPTSQHTACITCMLEKSCS